MKKLFLMMILALAISLTACGNKTEDGNNNDNDDSNSNTTTKFVTTPAAPDNLKPKLAIIYSKSSEKNFWTPKSYAQLFMSVQSQAMMAGLPYDLLNEDDLLDLNKIRQYKTLLFPLFSYVKNDHIQQIADNLKIAIEQYDVGIVTASNFLTNTETGDSIAGDAYVHMKNLLGLARVDGAGPVDRQVNIADANHPALADEYRNNETVLRYSKSFTDYFIPTGAFPSRIITTQTINNSQTENELIAISNKGRHAHFATVQSLADGNMLWSVLQWSVWGEKAPVTLQMGRDKALFIARNDMDQSMFTAEVASVEIPLLEQLKIWKNRYNFVGSYYINIGNNPTEGEFTDWQVSAPLYKQYIQLGNEIGSHSYTHPADTNLLSEKQIQFQFADAQAIIKKQMGLDHLGAAVPGNPENLATSLEILPHVDYLSGGYSAVGSGFPNAFGFLNADSTKVYLSPNLSFDFTLVQFQKHSATEAAQIWSNEFDELAKHASQPIFHWPWHDYAPNDSFNVGYTLEMFEGFLAKAKNYGSEFITGENLSERIKAFKQSAVEISTTDNNRITASVKSTNASQFALKLAPSKSISSVDNWYAYNQNSVFLDEDGGIYTIRLGTPRSITHISKLPSRSKLLTLSGNGEDIKFRFSGEGNVEVTTKCANPTSIKVTGGINTYQHISSNKIALNFLVDRDYLETVVDIECD